MTFPTRRVLKWVAMVLAGVVAVALIAAISVYALSARILNRTYDVPAGEVAVPGDSASVAEGGRLATLRGCYGCHHPGLEGGVFVDDPMLARLVAPNLTRAVRQYPLPDLVRILRHGVYPNGRSVIGMPSEMFNHLADSDLGKIIAAIRAEPETAGPSREFRPGPLGRLGIVMKQFQPAAAMIDHAVSPPAEPPAEELAFGRYLAMTVCSECHGLDLGGQPGDEKGLPPDLRIAAGYAPDAFVKLMRTGIALGEREIGLMTEVARGRFAYFADAEVGALHAYLKTLPDSGR